MATYRVELDDGRVFRVEVEGNTPPTEEDLMAYIENNPQVESNLQVEDTSEDNEPVSSYDSNVLLSTLAHMDKARKYWQLKALSGGTFGASDFLLRRIPGADLDKFYNEAESTHPYIKPLGSATEFLASFPTGGGLLKGSLKGVQALEKLAAVKDAPKYLKSLAKLARIGYLPATGMAEGAASGYFATGSGKGALYGGVLGGVLSGALGAAGGLSKQGFSAARRVENIKPELENVIQSPKGGKILSKAVGANKAIAEDIHNKAPQLLEDINEKAIKQIDDVFGNQNVSEKIKKAKAIYSDFVEKNGNKQVINLKNDTDDVIEAVGLKGLSFDQEDVFKDVWESAYKATATRDGGNYGDLKHTRKVIEYLNDMIEGSKKPSPINVNGKPKPLTKDLADLKTKFLNRMSELGDESIREANRNYAANMRLQDAYEYGTQHSVGKFKDYGFKTQAEKDAFLRGVIDKASNNPETTNVAENVLGQIKVLRQTDRVKADKLSSALEKTKDTYKRLSNLDNKAFNKIEGFSQKKTKIPTISTALDTLQDIATGRKYRRAGKYLLNPQKHPLAEPDLIPYYNFGQQATNALIRELTNEEVR